MAGETKTVLIAVAISAVVLSIVAILAVNKLVTVRLLPIIGFCLFWANYVFLRMAKLRRENEQAPARWKFAGVLATAGIYFAGALWGIMLFAREREWYGIAGAAVAIVIGGFCLVMSARLQRRYLREREGAERPTLCKERKG